MKNYQISLQRIDTKFRVIACLIQIAIFDIILYILSIFILNLFKSDSILKIIYNIMGIGTIFFYGICNRVFFNDMDAKQLKKSVIYAMGMEIILFLLSIFIGGVFAILYQWIGGMAWIVFLVLIFLPTVSLLQLIAQLAMLAFPLIFLVLRKGK